MNAEQIKSHIDAIKADLAWVDSNAGHPLAGSKWYTDRTRELAWALGELERQHKEPTNDRASSDHHAPH
jgi:hypothetical protein